MRYHNITRDDMRNGDGLRVVLWVAGCSHHCQGCQNPVTWVPDGGLPFTDKEREEIISELKKDYVSGITFSGGDPLYPANREEVTALARIIKRDFPDKTIWLYTGYLWEEVETLEITRYLDVLVDGKFQLKNKDVNLHWVGSGNQRVIDVRTTLKLGQIVLHRD